MRRNTVPFFILFLVHSFLMLFTFFKKSGRRRLFALLVSNIGFAYLFEFIVLNVFQGYKYKPNIFRRSYFNNIFGAILSQAIIIPFTTLFLTAFQVTWKVRATFIFYFYLIERLFIKLKVYKTNWWRPMFTIVFLPIYFVISDKWYKYLKSGPPFVLFVSQFLFNLVVRVNVLFIMALFRFLRFGRGRIHSLIEHFIMAPIYCIILSLFSVWSIQKEGWFGKVRVLLFNTGLDLYLYGTKKVKGKPVFLLMNFIVHTVILFLSIWYKKLLYEILKRERSNNERKSPLRKQKHRILN